MIVYLCFRCLFIVYRHIIVNLQFICSCNVHQFTCRKEVAGHCPKQEGVCLYTGSCGKGHTSVGFTTVTPFLGGFPAKINKLYPP